MHNLMLDGRPYRVSTRALFNSCDAFAHNPVLLTKPYEVQSRVSDNSFCVFVAEIGGSDAVVTGADVKDLRLLCNEVRFVALVKTIADWQAANPTGTGTDAVTFWICDRLASQDRGICSLEHEIDRLRRAHDDVEKRFQRQCDEMKAAIAGLNQAATREWDEISGLKNSVGNIERMCDRQRESGDACVTEQTVQGLRASNEGLEKRVVRVESALLSL
jgi:hypothetical protein